MSEQTGKNAETNRLKMNRSWQWLLYLDVVLPGVLLLLALLPVEGLRQTMARLYHTYTLFIMNPVPNFSSFTGMIGLVMHAGLLVWAVVRRDWRDVLICAAFAAAAAAFFLVQVDGIALNYLVVRGLDFGGIGFGGFQ